MQQQFAIMQGAEDPWTSPLRDAGVEPKLLLTIAVKFADIGHVTKPFAIHKS